MNSRLAYLTSAGLLAAATIACSSSAQTPGGAPSPSRPLTAQEQARADSIRQPYTAADIAFMTGMIRHHAQAVLMAGWAPTHGASASVRALCERIVVGQRDEIRFMQIWLKDRNQPAPAADASHDMMPGMDHPMLMPGMLTPEELTRLDQARGPEWDRLFLTGMIKHHQGALTMVQDLMNSPGAAQEDLVFKFVSDINADQTTEIERMTGMLEALPPAPGSGR